MKIENYKLDESLDFQNEQDGGLNLQDWDNFQTSGSRHRLDGIF